MPDLLVPARFCGPPASGNGGWTAGALAALVDADPATGITVSLMAPPPLDTPMTVAVADGVTVATHDGAPVARAEAATASAPEVEIEAVAPAVARAAEATYAGLRAHPFPTCFSCGTDRADGLRIFPGQVPPQAGRARVAATWTPAESDLATTWAALDCVGGWAGDLEERLMVLARMTAWVDGLPEVGVEHVALGLGGRVDGRKTHTSSALVAPDGRVVGRAEHLWIAVDPARFAG
ncbi:hypothetical protein [Nocardioides sp. SR21]|uniref:hypothetical protein n=1 Tax=Nocardioides sp. SR21 TaxID=2919501 RepID=UPI001FAA45C1|nr:hypothetical protein [Nocardioides sp. SR21]